MRVYWLNGSMFLQPESECEVDDICLLSLREWESCRKTRISLILSLGLFSIR